MKVLSDWRSVRLWESRVESDLHRGHDLRAHGFGIGTAILLLMWGLSHLQMRLGVDSLALRYLVTLGGGYLAYLLMLRWWAGRLLQGNSRIDPDAVDFGLDVGGSGLQGESASGGGLGSVEAPPGGIELPDIAGSALDVAAGADEGAVIVVPVLAVFLFCAAVVLGAGALVLLYFGSETLLAVAVEIAFSYVSARAAVRLAREGWLVAAVRLTWKPLLGALLCAVLLGALVDRFMPQANSLPAAVRMLLRALSARHWFPDP